MNTDTHRSKNNPCSSVFICGLLFVLLAGCSAGKLKPDVARKIIAQETGVPEKQIKILSTSGASNTVVADATVQLAFSLQTGSDGKWHVLKISRMPGQWEDPSAFGKSLASALHA